MAILYVNSKGNPVTFHSYSAGQDFRTCPHLYYLKRVKGLREVESRAAGVFGSAVEDALRYYHEHGEVDGQMVTQFKAIWSSRKEEIETFKFTDKEGSWTDMYRMGAHMARLYELRWRSFGYSQIQFQLSYKPHLFPSSSLHGIHQSDFIDMKAVREERPIVIDVKTSKSTLNVDKPSRLRLDPQLREYAWITKVNDVAFLWFSKAGASYKAGDTVTIIEPITTLAPFHVGDDAVVAFRDKDTGLLFVMTPDDHAAYVKELDEISGKGTKDRTAALRAKSRGTMLRDENITKVRLQFVTTQISEEGALGEAEAIRNDIVRIVRAGEEFRAGAPAWKAYPRQAGIRFPNNVCDSCCMREICSDEAVTLVESIAPPPQDQNEDWLA